MNTKESKDDTKKRGYERHVIKRHPILITAFPFIVLYDQYHSSISSLTHNFVYLIPKWFYARARCIDADKLTLT